MNLSILLNQRSIVGLKNSGFVLVRIDCQFVWFLDLFGELVEPISGCIVGVQGGMVLGIYIFSLIPFFPVLLPVLLPIHHELSNFSPPHLLPWCSYLGVSQSWNESPETMNKTTLSSFKLGVLGRDIVSRNRDRNTRLNSGECRYPRILMWMVEPRDKQGHQRVMKPAMAKTVTTEISL